MFATDTVMWDCEYPEKKFVISFYSLHLGNIVLISHEKMCKFKYSGK